MDIDAHQEVCRLVEQIVTSGEAEPDPALLALVKSACRASEDVIRTTFRQLLLHLEKEHAQIRLSVFQLTDVLFMRSHLFRCLVTDKFQLMLNLFLGSAEKPLPRPKRHAALLKEVALRSVLKWNEKYGQRFKQLALGHAHVLDKCRADLAKIRHADEQRDRQAQRRVERAEQRRLEAVEGLQREMTEKEEDITRCVQELTAVLSIILPDARLFDTKPERRANGSRTRSLSGGSSSSFVPQSSASASATPPESPLKREASTADDDILQVLGVTDHAFELEITVRKDHKVEVQQDEDNAPVLDKIQELTRVACNIYQPLLERWCATAVSNSAPEDVQRRITDLKACLQRALEQEQRVIAVGGLVDSDQEDFVEVSEAPQSRVADNSTVPSAEAIAADDVIAASTDTSVAANSCDKAATVRPPRRRASKRPARVFDDGAVAPLRVGAMTVMRDRMVFAGATLDTPGAPSWVADAAKSAPGEKPQKTAQKHKQEGVAGGDEESREEILAKVPVVPYGVDLDYWGKERTVVQRTGGSHDAARFWIMLDEEDGRGKTAEDLGLTRRTEFVEKAPKAKFYRCRARLHDVLSADGTIKLCQRECREQCNFHGPIVPRDDFGVPLDPACAAREEAQRAAKLAERLAEAKGKGKKRQKKGATAGSKLIDLKTPTVQQRLKKKLRTAVSAIDPTLDKIRKAKFEGNWVNS